MDEDFIKRICAAGLPVHNASGLPVFYNNGDDDLYVWGKTNRKRRKAIVISVPRSGTHFISKLLSAMGMIYGGLHVSPKVETDVVQDRRCFKLNAHGKPFWPEYNMAVADAFRLVGPGQFIQGHVPFSAENQAALADFKIVVVRRNLRDVAVSSMRFIASLHAKGMRFHPDLDARWCPMRDGAEKMLEYLNSFGGGVGVHVGKIAPWEACHNAQVLDFDVINGADQAAALAAIVRAADFLGSGISARKALAIRKRAMGGGTVTWSGKLSRWQELWNDEVEETFRRVVLSRDGAAPPAPTSLAAEAATSEAPPAPRSAPSAGSIAWLRNGDLVNQALRDGAASARAALMAEICKDRLLSANRAQRLTLDLSARRYLTDGVQAELRDDTLCAAPRTTFIGGRQLDSTNGNRLFVLGHARSGTTILGRLFNSAQEVLLLGEAHLFESHWNRQFVTNFNAHHQRTKKVKSKGTRLPSQYVGMLPEEILQELSQHYQWVGEKIAIGPMAGLGSRAASHALDYYQAHHLDAHYVLSFRAPAPSLDSLRRLFPRLALSYLLQGWMLSFIEVGAASNILKHVCLAPLELMSMPYWERIQQKIGIVGRADASWIDAAAGQGASDSVRAMLAQQLALELGWEPERARQFMQRLSRLYAEFVALIDPQTLYFRPCVLFADRVAQKLLGDVQDMCAQLGSPSAASATLPGSACGWLKQDAMQSDRRVMPLPSERMQRFSAILRDSLFIDARLVPLSDEQCAFPMQADGIDIRREGPWLRLKARPGTGGHKHLTIRLPIEPLAIATARLLLRREPGHSRYLMLQMGGGAGFHKSVFDCQQQQVASIAASGPAKSVFSQIELLANGDFRISVSGILANGEDSYLRLYMCDESGSIDFQHAGAELMINDFVLSYSAQDCGLEELI